MEWTFFARMYGSTRKMVEEVRRILEERQGHKVSNPGLLMYFINDFLENEARKTGGVKGDVK